MTLHGSRTWTAGNGVLTAEKTIESPKRTPTLVTFSITATADTPLSVCLVDTLPEEVPITTVGFHPEYKFDRWTLYGNGEIAFTDAVAPGETMYAFYYLREDFDHPLSAFDAPTITRCVPASTDAIERDGSPTEHHTRASVVSKETIEDGPVPDLLELNADDERQSDTPELEGFQDPTTGDRRATGLSDLQERIQQNDPEPRDSEDTEPEKPTEAIFEELQAEFDQTEYERFGDEVEQYYPSDVSFDELIERNRTERNDASPERTERVRTPETDPQEAPAESLDSSDGDDTPPGDVLPALIEELEEYDLSERERHLVAEKFGLTTQRHTSVKLRHLQSEVADLAAYIDALEEFLDDNGTAAELLGALEDGLDAVHARQDRVEESVDETARTQNELRERVEALEGTVDAVPAMREELDEVRETVEANRGRIDETETRLRHYTERVTGAVDSIEQTIANNREQIERLEETASSVQTNYEKLCSALGSTAEALSGESTHEAERDDEGAGSVRTPRRANAENNQTNGD